MYSCKQVPLMVKILVNGNIPRINIFISLFIINGNIPVKDIYRSLFMNLLYNKTLRSYIFLCMFAIAGQTAGTNGLTFFEESQGVTWTKNTGRFS